jgi:hypothetical protein
MESALHPSVEDLKRYALGQVPTSHSIETHLLQCRTCRTILAELASGPKRTPIERRSEVRIALESPARIKALDPLTSIGPSSSGQVLNTSRTGVQLRVKRAFLPGSVVQIRFQDQIVIGTVKYCTPSGDEFQIGEQLKEDL